MLYRIIHPSNPALQEVYECARPRATVADIRYYGVCIAWRMGSTWRDMPSRREYMTRQTEFEALPITTD